MSAFSLDRTIYQMVTVDRDLPLNINCDKNGIGIVLGSDVSKVTDVEFRMRLFQPCAGNWHGKTLRELAWKAQKDVPISTADYSRLLSQVGRDVTADLMSVDGERRSIPKADSLLNKRLWPVHDLKWLNGPGPRVIARTDELLRNSDTAMIDDCVKNMVGSNPFREFLRGNFYEHCTIVAIVSEKTTASEEQLLAHYLNTAAGKAAPHLKIYLVVEDPNRWSRMCQNPEWAAWTSVLPNSPVYTWPREYSGRFELGHIRWPNGDLDNQIRRLKNLVTKVILDGGTFNNITVVAEEFIDALFIRQKMLEAGIPVKASESHLLPMRPQVLTLMSLLSVARGCGRLQGVSRMLEVWPELKVYGVERLLKYFAQGKQLSEERDYNIGRPAWRFMKALLPLSELTTDQNIRSWVDAALKAFDRLPSPLGHDETQEYGLAVCQWGKDFKSPEELLNNFWQLRAAYSDWEGYKGGSGVIVSPNPSKVHNRIAVAFQCDQQLDDIVVATENVFFAPVSARSECEV